MADKEVVINLQSEILTYDISIGDVSYSISSVYSEQYGESYYEVYEASGKELMETDTRYKEVVEAFEENRD